MGEEVLEPLRRTIGKNNEQSMNIFSEPSLP
jgi:hypothetical protein